MCGACGHAAADERVAGPRRRAASAAAVSALSGLMVRPALGIWMVSSATGRQVVCALVERGRVVTGPGVQGRERGACVGQCPFGRRVRRHGLVGERGAPGRRDLLTTLLGDGVLAEQLGVPRERLGAALLPLCRRAGGL